jgi:hypothetical protein
MKSESGGRTVSKKVVEHHIKCRAKALVRTAAKCVVEHYIK